MIKVDIPMPERCGVCFAMHTDEIGLESWCGIDETARDLYTDDINTKRPDWCPLKEQEAVKPTWGRGKPFCGACGLQIRGGKFCSECGKPVAWEGR